MKRTICAILACLLLCGCAGQATDTTEATFLPGVAPTEPSGSYAPGSEIEQTSAGAVRAYPQSVENIRAIKAVGEDLLVFSGQDTTVITWLTGENLFRVAEIRLDQSISRLYVGENRIAYFDPNTRELVFLNRDLRETSRMDLPADLVGEPVLTADRTKVYYCTASGVRCLETETGISRLVKEMAYADQYMEDIHLGDAVLQVKIRDGNGNPETMFLDAKTGALLGKLPEDMGLTSGAEYFYTMDPEGIVNQMVFGTESEIWQLVPENYLDSGVFLPEAHAAAVFSRDGNLDYYDLSSGKRTATLALGGIQVSHLSVSDRGCLYFVDNEAVIYRWDLAATATGDETVYIQNRYTEDAPDTEGLAQCRAYAEQLAGQFGLDIQLVTETDSLEPEHYDLIPEYQVPVIMDMLTRLEILLGNYPSGMFDASVEDLEEGKLTLLLVREIRDSDGTGYADSMDGLHFWLDNHSVVALAMGENLEESLYREMFRALESRLLSKSIACYRWDELNPKDFDYDYDYTANQSRDGSEYLEDTTRSFIDTFSMSFPREDRARVMEYACLQGKETYFISFTMQKKLRALCEGIREAYDLEDYPTALLWEQYLESPITP